MNTKSGLIIAAWGITCATAFFIGRTVSTPTTDAASDSSKAQPAVVSSRSTARSESSSDLNPRSGDRSRSRGAAPSEAQIADLQAKVRDLKKLSDPILRAEGFLELVRNLKPDEFLTAIAAFREGGVNNGQFGEYRLLLTAWAKVNPLEALDYAKEKTGTPYARQTILTAWAKTDSEGAISWARENFDENSDANRANPWMVSVISSLASTDLGRATQLLEELPFSRGRGEALQSIFDEVSANGLEDTKLWVNQLTDARLKEGAAARLAGQLANDDPQGAAEWASSLGPEVMARSAGAIVSRWANKDIDAAENWVNGQSQDIIAASGPSLVQRLVQEKDIATAADWLSNYEGEPAFDDSVRTLVQQSMNNEPTVAADWIMKLSSERDQERTFHRVLQGWMNNDREGALDYINNNPVPESIVRRATQTQ